MAQATGLSIRIFGGGGAMKRLGLILVLLAGVGTQVVRAQEKLAVRWEELSAAEFVQGIEKSHGTCLLPIGIMEKHGPHLPLGTDLFDVRYVSLHAAEEEYAVVFPEYYFSQIFEAKHEPGTVAYSRELMLKLLQETTDEMARNGCKKVVIVNGHGGNESFLPYFAQTQLESPHDYVVYVVALRASYGDDENPHPKVGKKDTVDMHAGESETSVMMVTRPDLVHLDRAGQESGADHKRDHLPKSVYTGIWWYAGFPDHYSGDGSFATKESGETGVKNWIAGIVAAEKAIKADDSSLKLQNEFYEKSKHPLETKQ
jgi:creatinine amidohydrolase